MNLDLFVIFSIALNFVNIHSQNYYTNNQQQTQIKIGGIFNDVDDALGEITLKTAIKEINDDSTILPFHYLTLKSETIASPENSFYVTKAVCNLMQEGVIGIFGPKSTSSADHTQSICDRYDIPYIKTSWDYRTKQDKYSINLYPHPDTLGLAYVNLVEAIGWENLTILYDEEENLFKLQQLIRTATPSKRNITIRLLPKNEDFRPVLKSIQRELYVKNIVVDCNIFKTLKVLRQAEQVGMTRYDYSYVLTTLDLQNSDMEEYKYGEAQFYAFRLVDPDRPEVQSANDELKSNDERHKTNPWSSSPHWSSIGSSSNMITQFQHQPEMRGLTTSQALIFDGVKLFSKALDKNSDLIKNIQPINCNQNEAWDEGSTFLNDMRAMPPFHGLTGIVQFNTSGFRTDIILDVVTVTEKGLVKTGVWENSRSLGIKWIKEAVVIEVKLNEEQKDKLPLTGRHMILTTLLNDPFCMHKRSQNVLTNNDRFEGFSMDLIAEISKKLNFNYTIKLVEDADRYPGLIKEVRDGKADIAIADLTVTKDRQSQADFSMPFMNLGIAILFVKPQPKPPNLMSFMSPFAGEVWLYMAISFFGVSFVLFIVARLSPYEWDNPLPCITEPVKLTNQFTYWNSIWFTLGSIMQQGSDLAPKAVSTRIIAGIWWFFTLIMVSSYTANLATFLIVQDMEETISNLEQLSKQTKIKYGCVKKGSTRDFFQNATDSVKKQIYENMIKWEGQGQKIFQETNSDGIEAVKSNVGKFAFFMENTMIDYQKERNCILEQVGQPLDNKDYAIALKKNSPYLGAFNRAVLDLQEKGKLDELKRKWWKEERKDQAEICPNAKEGGTPEPLRLANVGGVFVVLLVGCFFSIFITCLEGYIYSRQKSSQPGVIKQYEFLKELQFALQCRGNVKQVKISVNSSTRNSREELGSTPNINYSNN